MTQLVMPFAGVTSYDPADYIRSASNVDAVAVLESWPNWPYSIMLLYGPKGCGKTHLAHCFADRSRAGFIAPERLGSAPADHLLTDNHAWVIDGLEAIRDEAALAQLINHARARGDYVLMTASTPASNLSFTLPDLRSRLLALPTTQLGAPDDALLMGLLAKQFSDRQLRVAPEVLALAVQHIERSHAAIEEFVQRMDRISLARGRAITVALVREALRQSG